MFDPKSQYFSYNNFGSHNLSGRIRRSAQNYENYTRINESNIQFRADNINDETDSCSPPLWKSSSPKNHGNLSPNSRSRAIAKGQAELMEMARNMPESCYELSLRDMVETPVIDNPKLDDEERCLVDEKHIRKSVKRQESKKVEKKMERVTSAKLENSGFFLKMGFPVSLQSKRKKNLATSNSKRVSPKVETVGKSSYEKDWWKRKFSGSSGSESAESGVTNTNSGSSKSTSSNDNSSNNRKSKSWSSGCWSFAFSRRNKRKFK